MVSWEYLWCFIYSQLTIGIIVNPFQWSSHCLRQWFNSFLCQVVGCPIPTHNKQLDLSKGWKPFGVGYSIFIGLRYLCIYYSDLLLWRTTKLILKWLVFASASQGVRVRLLCEEFLYGSLFWRSRYRRRFF